MANRTASGIIDRDFLELRARLLDMAASLDRIDRADGEAAGRLRQFEAGLAVLLDDEPDKARRIQEIYSRTYDPSWREQLQPGRDGA
jgi:hypothetical protein